MFSGIFVVGSAFHMIGIPGMATWPISLAIRPAIFGILFGFLWWLISAYLMDVVLDCKTSLIAVRGKRRAVISVDQIEGARLVQGKGVYLHIYLNRPCGFGKKISFLPTSGWQSEWPKSPVTDRIRELVCEAG
jgi:hypothetical protein